MHGIPDLIRLLDDPSDEDAFDRAFGAPEPLDLDDGVLPPTMARFFLTQEIACDQLADLGPAAIEAVPALLRCAEVQQLESPSFSQRGDRYRLGMGRMTPNLYLIAPRPQPRAKMMSPNNANNMRATKNLPDVIAVCRPSLGLPSPLTLP